MGNPPKVSIVIPNYNQGKYLPACVDHCYFQTYPNLELIIVDGGSTDSTKRYLAGLEREMAEKVVHPVTSMDSQGHVVRKAIQVYSRQVDLKIISFEHDIGPTQTYNEGLTRVTGAYCTYVVGDDLPHPHMIETMVDVLETTGADFVYSDMNLVDDSGRIVRQIRLPDYSFEKCLAEWYHLGVSHLYRSDLHQRAGLMDPEYSGANDYDHYLRFAMAGASFRHIGQILYSVRYHDDSRKTGQHTDERYANVIGESKRCAFRARAFLAGKASF